MAFSFNPKPLFFLLTLLSVATFCCKAGYEHAEGDPAQIVAKALLCFNNKFIYSSCDEAYRLTQSGNINVPLGGADQYCNGPCLAETHLILNCIENILSNFLFHNKATIQDIRSTLIAGCSYTSERGNFNVDEHIQASRADRVAYPTYLYTYMYVLIILGCSFLL